MQSVKMTLCVSIDAQHEYVNVMDESAPYNHDDALVLEENSVNDDNLLTYLRRIELLTLRERVLSALCGFGCDDNIVRAACRIQSVCRGHILRNDKKVFDTCVSFFLRTCRRQVLRGRFLRYRTASKTIQSYYRGQKTRRTPLGRALGRIIECSRDARQLRSTICRLSERRIETMQMHLR